MRRTLLVSAPKPLPSAVTSLATMRSRFFSATLALGVLEEVVAFGGEALLVLNGWVAWARMSSVFSRSMVHWLALFLTLEDATEAGR